MGNIQIKNVPEALHDRLRERASAEGTTLRDYALRVLERDVEKPTMREWLERVRARGPLAPFSREEIVEIIHQGRSERTQQILEATGIDPEAAAELSREP